MSEDLLQYWGTGRRKTAIARVRLRRGSGKITVNDIEMATYFHTDEERNAVLAPLTVTKTVGKFDIIASCHGGGKSGQSGAMTLGIARALKEAEPLLEQSLRKEGFLTRDARMKERKKYGRRGARRGFQFSKR